MKNKIIMYIIIGLICALLTYAILIQIRSVESFKTIIGTNTQQSELRDEVLKMKDKYDSLFSTIQKAEKTLEEERKNATNNNTELSAIETEIKETNTLLGLTEVTGKGIIVTIQDSTISANNYFGDASNLVVHDGYLIHIVNELFNAGAEAISINDQRIVSTTEIECDGNVIKINGVKQGSPYEIKAIGYPEQLLGISRAGGYIEEKIQKERMVSITIVKQEKVTIPKYNGIYKFNYAQ